MNKKEILEIKKLYSTERNCIQRIAGCYVNGDKEIVSTFDENFFSLPDEETFKYFELLKKSLSGSVGKNLLNFEFKTEDEFNDGPQTRLEKLRTTQLKENTVLTDFYNRIIQNFVYVGNFLILLTFSTYDIPQKGTDNITMEDASDEIYSYVHGTICPVKLSHPGLSYFSKEQTFHERLRDWVVDKPVCGFLFPSFTDRTTDIHSSLYYTKKPTEMYNLLLSSLFGKEEVPSSDKQRKVFQDCIKETIPKADMQMVQGIYEALYNHNEECERNGSESDIDKRKLKELLEISGINNDVADKFAEQYHKEIKQDEIPVQNLVNLKTTQIDTGSAVIKIPSYKIDSIKTVVVDGRQCIAVPIENNLNVDGIYISN